MAIQIDQRTAIVPMLYLSNVASAIDFYANAFAATERWRIDNKNATTHVAELEIQGRLLRLHEQTNTANVPPDKLNATTVVIHLLVTNPDELMEKAVMLGATVINPMKDYEYGYRQGNLQDPFGHHWCLERIDDLYKKPAFGS